MAYGMVYEDLIKKGVVFVDTKTEHGIDHMGRIVAGDEKYTMDSSRYWLLMADGSLVKDNSGKPVSFSKQFARDMIKDEATQQYTTEQANEIGVRYVMGLQHLTGQRFEPDTRPRDERLEDSMRLTLDSLGLD